MKVKEIGYGKVWSTQTMMGVVSEDDEDEGDLDDEPSSNSLPKKSCTGLYRSSQSR
jgi:hypothetical protein